MEPAPYPVRRNALLLTAGLVCLSGLFQLAVALSTVTLVVVTGVEGILGLAPAIFLAAGALAVAPAGRAMDRFGRMPVIQAGFAAGIAGSVVTGVGCSVRSGVVVVFGLGLAGASGAIVLLSRVAAAEMFPPERRARGISLVLFGAVSGAVWGPLIFGPLFANRALTSDSLVTPWLASGLFMVAGLVISLFVRPDPKTIAATHPGDEQADAAPLRVILRRPGVPTAFLGAVASFAVMVGVMNLSGYVAVGRHHHESDVFTIISAHIVGMYGLVLVVGDLVDRIGRRRSIVIGLAIMAVSNAALAGLSGLLGMSVCLFGLGLGWNLSYVAATTELISLTSPSERGRLVGFTDLLSSLTGAGLALLGGVVYSGAGAATLAAAATTLAVAPAVWIAVRSPGLRVATAG